MDEGFQSDLRRFAAQLERGHFRSLARGMGYYHRSKSLPISPTVRPEENFVNPVSTENFEPVINHSNERTMPREVPLAAQKILLTQPSPVPIEATRVNRKSGLAARFFRLVAAHVLDLFVVFASIVTLVLGLSTRIPGNTWLEKLSRFPLTQELMRLTLVEAGLVFYGLFLLYWALFRLMAGQTLGRYLFSR